MHLPILRINNYEQIGEMTRRYSSHCFAENAFDGLAVVSLSNRDALYAWSNWLKEQGFPALDQFPIEGLEKRTAHRFFICLGKHPQQILA